MHTIPNSPCSSVTLNVNYLNVVFLSELDFPLKEDPTRLLICTHEGNGLVI